MNAFVRYWLTKRYFVFNFSDLVFDPSEHAPYGGETESQRQRTTTA